MRRNVWFGLLGCSWLLFVGCGGKDKGNESGGEPKDNLTCESECVREHEGELADCYSAETSCINRCSRDDPTACIEKCEDARVGCGRGFLFCVGVCPCFRETETCIEPCEDLECFGQCTDAYRACAGVEGPYNCVIDCDNVRFDCQQSCEMTSVGAAELAACRGPCDSAYRDCQTGCGI